MREILLESTYFGAMLSLAAYEIGVLMKKKFKLPIFNPMLISVALIIIILIFCNIDYESYYDGAQVLSYLLTPATVCLAVPLYEQLELLRRNIKAVFLGIASGVVTSLLFVLLMSMLFHLDHKMYVTLLPKSITTAIGIGVSEELNGYVTITVAVIMITGIFGNMIGEGVCRLFHIKEPISRGVAIGTASHAMGTTKAMELGEIEGAMSSLSIAVSGLLTVAGATIFASFL